MNVIVAAGSANAIAAKAATKTIPIVFVASADPVVLGLVTSLSTPGGNITGVTRLVHAVTVKQLEFICELVPSATLIAVMFYRDNPQTQSDIRDLEHNPIGLNRKAVCWDSQSLAYRRVSTD